MAIESSGFGRRIALVGAERPHLPVALRLFTQGTRSYLLVSTVFGAIVAMGDWIALSIMGIPAAAVWGLLAFVTNYVPNIGFVLGVIPPALLGLLAGGWGELIAVVVVYSLLNFVVQTLIQPRFVGDSVGLSMTVTFIALLFWSWVMGALGALLAIPLTLLVKVHAGGPRPAGALAGRGAPRGTAGAAHHAGQAPDARPPGRAGVGPPAARPPAAPRRRRVPGRGRRPHRLSPPGAAEDRVR